MSDLSESLISQQELEARSQGVADILTWVHDSLTAPELLASMQEVDRDMKAGRFPRLSVTSSSGQLQAAAYFRLLAGKVASLGGLRATRGHEGACVQLLSELTSELVSTENNLLVQAIVDKADSAQHQLLERSGYVRHTDVLQLWLDLGALAAPADSHADNQLEEFGHHTAGYRWERFSERSHNQIIELISSTFAKTLDCPMLNQLRTPEDVLIGFQDGRPLSQLNHWYVLHKKSDRTDIGCLLITQHSPAAVEIVYLGLAPNARGQRLGVTLVNQAVWAARELGAEVLVAAVDSANWPALKTYFQIGFQVHQTKSVFFRASDVRASAATVL